MILVILKTSLMWEKNAAMSEMALGPIINSDKINKEEKWEVMKTKLS